jgi:anti-sigma-K factor RskA
VDPYVEDDAAYVMGALTVEDRRAFETHLTGCSRCTQSVAELSGMTDLLDRVPLARVLEPEPGHEPPPELLLPGLMRAARAQRRRRSVWLIASGAVAATVVALALVIGVSLDRSAQPTGTTVAMTPVRPAAVTATLQVTPASWGTRVSLDCRWVGSTAGADWDVKKTYRLVAVPTDGAEPQVLAQWAVIPGEDARVVGSTDLATDLIARFELRAVADNAVLLEAEPEADVRS